MTKFKEIILFIVIASILGVCIPYIVPCFEQPEINVPIIEPLTPEEIEKIREIIK